MSVRGALFGTSDTAQCARNIQTRSVVVRILYMKSEAVCGAPPGEGAVGRVAARGAKTPPAVAKQRQVPDSEWSMYA